IPLPSEIIMPLAGWMVYRGVFDFWIAVIAGTVGNTLGSTIAYWVGSIGGRPIIAKYGRYVLISEHDLDIADRWFAKYGHSAVLFSRLLPVVRTFISFPAGVTRMNFGKFVLYSTLGALPWVAALCYAGKLMGDNWVQVRGVLHNLDYPILAVLIALVGYYVYRHMKPKKKHSEKMKAAEIVKPKSKELYHSGRNQD
ncbi:MAG TPA: DedA family protein, partial [Chloroflexota bacterium]|nr:DedA family protein [Chloroflexota bacterium]